MQERLPDNRINQRLQDALKKHRETNSPEPIYIWVNQELYGDIPVVGRPLVAIHTRLSLLAGPLLSKIANIGKRRS